MIGAPEGLSGPRLVEELNNAAWAMRMPLGRFVAPLTSDPRKFIRQLHGAGKPKDTTVERIRALIEGREIPPAPPNNFQNRRDRGSTAGRVISYEKCFVERQRALADRAHLERRPGETLAAAVRRLELELEPAS